MEASSPTPLGMSRINSNASAQAWEESLGQVSSLTDHNIAKLSEMQRMRQSISHDPIARHQLTQPPPPPPPLSLSSRSAAPTRAQSAPRQPKFEQSTPSGASHSYNSNLMIGNDGLERKIDFLMKRTRQLEDKIKRTERETVVNNETTTMSCSAMEQLLESQKNDKKTILGLRESMSALKSQMEVLIHRDEVRERSAQRPTPGQLNSIDVETIKEVVFHRVETDFQKVIQEVVRACACEQATYLSHWAEREKAEREKALKGGVSASNAVGVLEQEVNKITQDMLRLKGRQDSVDASLIEVRDVASVREQEASENHKRAISSYRTEMQTVVDAVGRKINEQLAALSAVNIDHNRKLEDNMLQQEHEMMRISAHLQLVEESMAGLNARVNNLSTAVTKCEDQTSHALSIATSADNSCRRSAEQTESVMKIAMQSTGKHSIDGPSTSSGSLSLMESRVNSAMESIHSLQISLDRLSSASVSATGNLEERVESLLTTLQAEQQAREQAINQVHDGNKRLKAKLRDINNNLSALSQTRERVENIVTELEEKKKQDLSKYSQLSASLDKMQLRQQQLDSTSLRLRDDFKIKIAQIQDSVAKSSDLNSSNAIASLKLQIASHDKQISEINDAISGLQNGYDNHQMPDTGDSQRPFHQNFNDSQHNDESFDERSTSNSSLDDDMYNFQDRSGETKSVPANPTKSTSMPDVFGSKYDNDHSHRISASSRQPSHGKVDQQDYDDYDSLSALAKSDLQSNLQSLPYSPIPQTSYAVTAAASLQSLATKQSAANFAGYSRQPHHHRGGWEAGNQLRDPEEPSSPIEMDNDFGGSSRGSHRGYYDD